MPQFDTSWILPLVLAIAASSGFWAWLDGRAKLKAARLLAAEKLAAAAPASIDHALAKVAESQTDFAKVLMDSARREAVRLEGVVEKLSARLGVVEDEHRRCQEETMELRGEVRDLKQVNHSLVEQLRRHGIEITDNGPADAPDAALLITGPHPDA